MGNEKVGHKSLCDLKENALSYFSDVGFESFCVQQDKIREKNQTIFVSISQLFYVTSNPLFPLSCVCRWSNNLAKHYFPFPFVLALGIVFMCFD